MPEPGDVASGAGWELRCGDYREVLADVAPDHVITDPPYSNRTHDGQADSRSDGSDARQLGYAAWAPADAEALVERFAAVGWLAAFADDLLAAAWLAAAEARSRTGFAPLACVQPGSTVRLSGDGPANWTTWLSVSRARALHRWGSLPGAYVGPPIREPRVCLGAKPLWLMRAIVRDYSRRGELVCDPCAGSGTTLLAAVSEGRRAIGAELDPATWAAAVTRLRRGYTPALDLVV